MFVGDSNYFVVTDEHFFRFISPFVISFMFQMPARILNFCDTKDVDLVTKFSFCQIPFQFGLKLHQIISCLKHPGSRALAVFELPHPLLSHPSSHADGGEWSWSHESWRSKVMMLGKMGKVTIPPPSTDVGSPSSAALCTYLARNIRQVELPICTVGPCTLIGNGYLPVLHRWIVGTTAVFVGDLLGEKATEFGERL